MIEVYEKKIIQWANDRGLLQGTTIEKQTLKLIEEAGELCKAVMKNDMHGIVDGVGDMMVVMTNICAKLNIDLMTCYLTAWTEIKNRNGKMVNGTFVKDADLDRG